MFGMAFCGALRCYLKRDLNGFEIVFQKSFRKEMHSFGKVLESVFRCFLFMVRPRGRKQVFVRSLRYDSLGLLSMRSRLRSVGRGAVWTWRYDTSVALGAEDPGYRPYLVVSWKQTQDV